jgi:hypothetical protein
VTVNEMAAALNALCDFSIRFSDVTRKWWVSAPIEIAQNGILSSGADGHSDTPEEAVRQYWKWVTSAGPTSVGLNNHLRVSRNGEVWRGRWNGFMWAQEPRP